MPCAGPTAAEERTMAKQRKLFSMVLVLNKRARDNGFFLPSDMIVQANSGLDMVERWVGSPGPIFDKVTAMLCEYVKDISAEHKEILTGNINSKVCRDFVQWIEDHDKVDRDRKVRELEVAAKKAAQEAYDNTYDQVLDDLMEEAGIDRHSFDD